MRAFLVGLLAIAVISAAAGFMLQEFAWTSQAVYSTDSVRLD